jgi:hypothetical protein
MQGLAKLGLRPHFVRKKGKTNEENNGILLVRRKNKMVFLDEKKKIL